MQKGKNKTGEKETPSLKVVTVENNQANIEREIEKHINKIRSLITKLRPAERQKYLSGLLSHILDEPAGMTVVPVKGKKQQVPDADYSHLSHAELRLIEELSVKMEQLYRTMDHDPS